jgi:hypothetical protein
MTHNLLLLLVTNLVSAGCLGNQPPNDSLLTGAWKGTSICQVRPSPCHDEVNVYHITETKKANTFHVVMNKIINDAEEDMAAFDYTFNPKDNTLIGYEDKYKINVKLTVNGNKMEGVMLGKDNVIYRVIKLTKEQ